MSSWVTRRRALVALVATGALAMAACGGDDSDDAGAPGTGDEATPSSGPATSGRAAAQDADPNGVVRMTVSLDSEGGVQLDPADSAINTDENWIFAIYGTLLRETESGSLEPWLAESVEVVDSQTIKVVLREGLTFSDGTPYDAEAVRRGVLRNLNEPGSPAVVTGRNFTFKELGDLVVDGPRELTFQLSSPVAGEFMQVLAGREVAVPSPASLDAGIDPSDEPIGAGPYVLDTYRPSQVLSLRKNPTFFEADEWPLGGIDFVHAVGEAAANAVLGGQADLGQITQGQMARFEADSSFETQPVSRDFDYYSINFCRAKPPFDNIQVRKAVQAAIDRDALNLGLLGGKGSPAYGFWPEGHRYHNEEGKAAAGPDHDRARQLLAESGVRDVTFDLVQSGQTPLTTRLGEIVQAQLAEVGINARLQFFPNVVVDWIQPQKPGAAMFPGSRPGIDRVAKFFNPTSQQALCGTTDEQIMGWADEIASLSPDDPKVAELYAQIEQRIHDQAYVVFLVKAPLFYAWNTDHIGGEPTFSGQKGLPLFDSFYVKR